MREVAVAAVLAVACSSIAGAQAPAPLSLTLEEAVRRGIEASHRVVEAEARSQGAAAVVGQRHAATLPQLAALAGYTRTNHVETFGVPLPNGQVRVIYPDIPDNYRARFDAQWPIYTGGRTAAAEDAARNEAAAAAMEPATRRAEARLDVTRAYWALATAIDAARVVDESLASMAVHLRDVRNQLAAGLVPPNDVMSVEAQESRQRMLSIRAGATREVAEAELARLLGLPPGTALQPVVALDAPTPMDTTVEALVEAARENRPERKALQQRVEAAKARSLAVSAGLKPTVVASGGFEYAEPNPRIFPRAGIWNESWDVGVNVNWPVFDGGKTRAEMAEAAAGIRVAEAQLAQFDDGVALEVRQSSSELRAGLAAIGAAESAIAAATEARRVEGERFAAGVSTSTDVLDAQLALLQVTLDRTQAVAEARMAQARLVRAIGRD